MRTEITPKELAKRLSEGQRIHIVDVREPHEFQAGHLPGAINMPLDGVDGDLPGIPKDEPVAIVCRSGVRSLMACHRVAQDYETVYNVAGGTVGWIQAGLGTVTPPKALWSPERQTHFVAGLLVWTGILLSLNANPWWLVLSAMPGFGLLLHATTGICPMTLFLKRMPWNDAPETSSQVLQTQ